MKSRVQIAREIIAGMGDWGSGTTRIEKLKKAGYDPDQVQGDINTILCCRENIITNIKAMAHTIADNNNWWYIYWTEKYGHECAICYPHGGENHGWQCIGYAMACWHHGGLPITCYCGTIANEEWEAILNAKTDAAALKKAQSCLGIKDIKVIRNKKGIPKSQTKPGDMGAIFHSDGEYYHTFIIMSDSKIADSTTQTPKANNIRADRNFGGRYVDDLKVIIRYTGKGLCSPPKRTVDQLAYEVIANLWGSGDSRVTALKEAGHDYNAVQKRVNEIISGGDKPQPEPTPKPTPTPTPSTKPTAIFNDFVESPARIGQACANEKGGTGGGKAGDQTGGEVCLSNYTYSTKSSSPYHWLYLYRAKNQNARLKIANTCIKACKNNHIGYDTNSPDRKSFFKEAQKVDWKVDKITTNCETTCSELANVCVASAGLKSYLPTSKQANVETLRKALASGGEFKSVKVKLENLQPGDILISDCHTAVVVGSIIRKGEESKRVADLQEYINWYTDGEFFKKCGKADGVYGNNTLKYTNKMLTDFFGAKEADGNIGSKTISKMKSYEKKTTVKTSTPSSTVTSTPTPTTTTKTTKKKYTGEIPTLRLIKSNAQVKADAIAWAKWIAGDNRFHYGYGQHAHHNGCYFCGTQSMKKNHGIIDPEFTYCCNPFVHAAWAHGGCIPKAISMCQNYSSWDFNPGQGYDASSLFDKLGHPAKSKLKAGDVLCNGSHVVLYIGNNKIAEASGGDDNKRNSSGWNNSIHITTLTDNRYKNLPRAYRFNGKVDADIIMRHGEVSDRVLQWQKFLDWYFDGAFCKECGAPDRYYGDNTLKWTKKFQEKEFGKKEADGTCGNKTFGRAKEIEK